MFALQCSATIAAADRVNALALFRPLIILLTIQATAGKATANI